MAALTLALPGEALQRERCPRCGRVHYVAFSAEFARATYQARGERWPVRRGAPTCLS